MRPLIAPCLALATFSTSVSGDDLTPVVHIWNGSSATRNPPSELFEALSSARVIDATNYISSEHIGVILDDGSIYLWGNNSFGECDPPGLVGTPQDPAVQLAVGEELV